MTLDRVHREHIVWRRVTGFSDLNRLRNAICGLLFDCAAETVVSVLLFVDEVCSTASERGAFPIEVCLVRGVDPHYLRVDIDGPELAAPGRPGFMDRGEDAGAAGWGVNYREQNMGIWAYLTLPMPAHGHPVAPWSRLAVQLPANPMLN
ncbi:hypothetical protein LWP59_21990 [Amycolatopsis acidiphila]|uniref:ATP-binding protein n=1 Tax=Amycolatopsis acidiphila TaxID=715473 RepID=A0A557ZUZ0_9PSEU|nr:hypothetical protein [Amycolatopsis acidiphila]TVT15768.1 hypothetical protein FNH06_35760 [Amycolatopsis acidiphila]UIJ56842.1 hypothetical protein LWP59_21990 [Amycolatopsis acidiphila]GHG54828.1 hypothetical protein GCM10017788_04840 [Amycolatopsis acidiphila]